MADDQGAVPGRVLIVFARAPVPGRCKTRLAPRFGARGAARIHRQLSERTLALAASTGLHTEIWCEPDARHAFFRHGRARYGFGLRRQAAGDLGRKMGLALKDAFRRGARAVVIVGTDCATLAAADITRAFAALEAGSDAVLQPAADGGYVLIGARRNCVAALRGIYWSSGRELAQTRSNLARAGFTIAELPPLWDVDHPRDVARARREGLL